MASEESDDLTEDSRNNSLKEFYTNGGIHCGLESDGPEFKLNKKPFQIFSGSLHYFRVLPERWEDSVKKMKHCGLNTVCTYVPWNLHEDKPGEFNFGGRLNLKGFIETVQNQDMFLILRPGPYICAELDFGGLPSWLLKDENMKVRSSYPPFLKAVEEYFTELLTVIFDYQFSINGGAIIAVQVENEFASYGDTQHKRDDYNYMEYLRNSLRNLGVKELLFTCDMPSISSKRGSLEDVLMTANFQTDAEEELGLLKKYQPDKPLMVAELWCGWFDQWGEGHKEVALDVYIESLQIILKSNASFNIYVFQGGTNFGFMNGANLGFPTADKPYCSTVTSYDYGALLTEDGRCTEKYTATLSILKFAKTEFPKPGYINFAGAVILREEEISVRHFLPLHKMLPFAAKTKCKDPVPMELLDFNGCGQRFGFTVYETEFNCSGILKFCVTRGTRTIVLVNNSTVASFENSCGDQKLNIEHSEERKCSTLTILIENLGRINFTETKELLNDERRGITRVVTLDEKPLNDWSVYNLDFNARFIYEVTLLHWDDVTEANSEKNIGFYFALKSLEHTADTFLYSSTWTKGVAFVNGYNIGRYWNIGPQQSLFLPSQLLNKGLNEIIVFELHSVVESIQFKESHMLSMLNT